jgi:hypothetical protein
MPLRCQGRPGAIQVGLESACTRKRNNLERSRVTLYAPCILCTDQYCSRYMLGTLGKGEISTGVNHLGFRCANAGSRDTAEKRRKMKEQEELPCRGPFVH